MALTRAALREMGVTEKEVLDSIMEAHGAGIEALKESAKEAAKLAKETIDGLQAKVDSKPTDNDGDSEWKSKYENEVKAHKATVESHANEKITSAQDKAILADLIDKGAHEQAASLLLGKVDRSKIVFEGDAEKGFTVKNGEEAYAPVKAEHSAFFGEIKTVGAGVPTPPKGEIGKSTGHQDMNAFIRGAIE